MMCYFGSLSYVSCHSDALFPLRLPVALRGERYRDADSVSISLATQRNAQP